MTSETRNCQNCNNQFVIEPEDFEFYTKMSVPPPTFCPQCRMQRRMMFRNERSLYKRNCDKCGKGMVTMFAPEKAYTVYCGPCWWSDSWDALDYGQDYDPSRPFFEQLDELMHRVPMAGISTIYSTLVNSDYINESSHAKNCYLIFNSDYCENSYYSTSLTKTKDVMDGLLLFETELAYESVNCARCFNIFFSEDTDDSHDIYFSKNLSGCSNCFGCVNLRNKSYYIWNEPHTKEEYAEKILALKERMGNAEELPKLIAEAEAFWKKFPQKFMHGLQNVNVTGEYVYNSKNAHHIYQGDQVEDSKYCQILKDEATKDAYDYTVWGANAERIYESITVGENVNTIKFGVVLYEARNVEYTFYGGNLANVFGSASLIKKEYCILNKQYSKEDYERLRAQIVADMQTNPYVDQNGRTWRYGEFFPYFLSPFAYNETIAQEYLPIAPEEAKANGWEWQPANVSSYVITHKGKDLPNLSGQVSNDLAQAVIECISCQRAYKLIPTEIELLQRFGFPAPRSCSECRHKRRFARLNPMKLWKRNCARCNAEIETSYAPDRPEIVYCEQCYQAEVI